MLTSSQRMFREALDNTLRGSRRGIMKTFITLFSLVGLMAGVASAGTISYDTTGSTLSCNGSAGCVQNTPTSITDGGLTLTYNSGSGANVSTPSIINFGNIVSSGTGVSNLTGLLVTINVNSTLPGSPGALPNGEFTGVLGTNNSLLISFPSGPNNTTTGFGTLPGVVIGDQYTYQVLQTTLGIQPPSVGNPAGETSIQGAVTDSSVPEPSTLLPMLGLGLVFLWRRATR